MNIIYINATQVRRVDVTETERENLFNLYFFKFTKKKYFLFVEKSIYPTFLMHNLKFNCRMAFTFHFVQNPPLGIKEHILYMYIYKFIFKS